MAAKSRRGSARRRPRPCRQKRNDPNGSQLPAWHRRCASPAAQSPAGRSCRKTAAADRSRRQQIDQAARGEARVPETGTVWLALSLKRATSTGHSPHHAAALPSGTIPEPLTRANCIGLCSGIFSTDARGYPPQNDVTPEVPPRLEALEARRIEAVHAA